MNIVTHVGSAHPVVKSIIGHLGQKLTTVNTMKDAFAVNLDALILLGGNDISPQFYGEKTVYARAIDRDRDAIEWVLVRKALTLEVPIMGICRGHQMLTIATGGSLFQDIYRQNATRTHLPEHRLMNVKPKLARWMADDTVNSYHHQAVKRVPDGFKVMAESKDGIIESIWRPGALGVQFHPEMMFPNNPSWIGLFKWFISGLQ